MFIQQFLLISTSENLLSHLQEIKLISTCQKTFSTRAHVIGLRELEIPGILVVKLILYSFTFGDA